MAEIKKWTEVSDGAKIGTGTVIESFTVITDDVEIGKNCWIGPHVTIMAGSRIGDNCKIFPGAVIGAEPQDLKFGGEYSIIEIGNNVTIREYCTLNRGTEASGKTVIKDNCLLMAYVHVAHDCVICENAILVNNVNIAGHVTVGKYAILGGLTAVHQFVKIGDHVMISGGSLVRKDVPPYIKVAREPLSYIGVNSIGLKRRGFDDARVNRLHEIYRKIFVKDISLKSALEEIQDINMDDDAQNVINFIENSDRGIVKGYR